MAERFVAEKRTALDGRAWWCIYDTERHEWSKYTFHGIYKTRRAANIAIEYGKRYF